MRKFLTLALMSLALAACTPAETPTEPSSAVAPKPSTKEGSSGEKCVVAGCSRELCLSSDAAQDLMSTCEWKDEYRCAQMMTCETQADGKCGFTPNEKSETCMKELPKGPASL
ncbi:MAG TPA: hypothetical protein PL182_11835 [Pseudobdellovibrionaceae bacterium]|nr:hypothetical protein [Pseudobdellovibrionaceae bacterium]